MRTARNITLERFEAHRFAIPDKRSSGSENPVAQSAESPHSHYAKSNIRDNFLIRVTGRVGKRVVEGAGEAQPRHRSTGDGAGGPGDDQDAAAAWEFLRAACHSLHGRTLALGKAGTRAPEAIRAVMGELAELAREHAGQDGHPRPFRGTLLGLEVALLDVAARACGHGVAELLGARREQVAVTASTIGKVAPQVAARRAAKHDRYPANRLKVGSDPQRTLARLEAVAAANRAAGVDKSLWAELTSQPELAAAEALVDGAAQRMAAGSLPGSVVLEGLATGEGRGALPGLQRRADEAARAASAEPLELLIMASDVSEAAELAELAGPGGVRAVHLRAAQTGGLLAALDLARDAERRDPELRIGLGAPSGGSDLNLWALGNLARALPRLDYFTVTPPSSAEQRITEPRVRYREQGSNILTRQTAPGIGARAVMPSVRPYVSASLETAPVAGGPVDRRIAALGKRKRKLDGQIHDALRTRVSLRAMRRGDDQHHRDVAALLEFAEPRHTGHLIARELERYGISLRSGLSFTALMLEQSEAYQLGAFRPAWLLDAKPNAYAFADELGVPRPQSDRKRYTFEGIEPREGVVLKPVQATGARGAYAVYALDRIRHIQDGREFGSWQQMAEHASWLMSEDHPRRVPDKWMVEELILEDPASDRLATDLKFFACYGRVVLIRESRRVAGGAQQVRFASPDGAAVATGHDDDPLVDGHGPTAAEMASAVTLSEQMPVPFMRIDMLRGQHGPVLGEFTPRPGQFEQFNATWDRALAEAWALAEGRITHDVLAGKDFAAFAKATATRPEE